MTTGTYNFVSFTFNVAFVAEISTSECTSETFAALSLVAAAASLFALLKVARVVKLKLAFMESFFIIW